MLVQGATLSQSTRGIALTLMNVITTRLAVTIFVKTLTEASRAIADLLLLCYRMGNLAVTSMNATREHQAAATLVKICPGDSNAHVLRVWFLAMTRDYVKMKMSVPLEKLSAVITARILMVASTALVLLPLSLHLMEELASMWMNVNKDLTVAVMVVSMARVATSAPAPMGSPWTGIKRTVMTLMNVM